MLSKEEENILIDVKENCVMQKIIWTNKEI